MKKKRKKADRPEGFYSTIGKKGGMANVKKHGTAHMKRIGKLAADVHWGKGRITNE